jgi:hypothetical protein
MADWKQITARIRRARNGKDPTAQLSNLYQKTRDAMVAFELARYLETSGQNSEAAKWYSTAADRFRRADWKSKAQQAAERLGGLPSEGVPTSDGGDEFNVPPISIPEPGLPFAQNAAAFESIITPAQTPEISEASESQKSQTNGGPSRRRHRGRRGGRNRRKSVKTTGPSLSTPSDSVTLTRQPTPPPPVDVAPESRFSRVAESVPAARISSETAAESATPPLRGRYGDPGLSSRLTLLEMQFRRLLTCSPLTVNEADRAPAGPGVLLLTDSDLTTYYYVEPCDTLRIAVGNLLRGSSRRGASSIKPQLAEHLGIAESRVPKYLADHCVVRYLQLDEGASHFAHFVISVLRPGLNE